MKCGSGFSNSRTLTIREKGSERSCRCLCTAVTLAIASERWPVRLALLPDLHHLMSSVSSESTEVFNCSLVQLFTCHHLSLYTVFVVIYLSCFVSFQSKSLRRWPHGRSRQYTASQNRLRRLSKEPRLKKQFTRSIQDPATHTASRISTFSIRHI